MFDKTRYRSASAQLSPCGGYRYWLTRELNAAGAGTCLFVMLNPSTADAMRDDPTIRRCAGFARDWGCGSLAVVNLFAIRATDPRELYKHPEPVGPANDFHTQLFAENARLVVAAWGCHGGLRGRADEVRRLFESLGVRLHHLGLTKDGHPRHPLYLPKAAKPEVW